MCQETKWYGWRKIPNCLQCGLTCRGPVCFLCTYHVWIHWIGHRLSMEYRLVTVPRADVGTRSLSPLKSPSPVSHFLVACPFVWNFNSNFAKLVDEKCFVFLLTKKNKTRCPDIITVLPLLLYPPHQWWHSLLDSVSLPERVLPL